MKFLKTLLFIIAFSSISSFAAEINVGQALSGFNSRIIYLENRDSLQEVLNGGFTSYMERGYSQSLTDNLTNLFLRINTRNGLTNLTLFGVETVIIEGTPVIQTNEICKYIDNRTFEAAVSNIYATISNQEEIVEQHLSETNAHFVTADLIGAVSKTNSFLYVLPQIIETNTFVLSSNAVFVVQTGTEGVVLGSPISVPDRYSRFSLHLIKGSGTISWFPGITWIYGESPVLDEEKTYVFGFESLDGTNWRGWCEYTY